MGRKIFSPDELVRILCIFLSQDFGIPSENPEAAKGSALSSMPIYSAVGKILSFCTILSICFPHDCPALPSYFILSSSNCMQDSTVSDNRVSSQVAELPNTFNKKATHLPRVVFWTLQQSAQVSGLASAAFTCNMPRHTRQASCVSI